MPLRKLEPAFHGRVWGTRDLDPWFPDAPTQTSELPIGEVWFETPEVPLLVKFLFTEQDLSVQVHPGDDYAPVAPQLAGQDGNVACLGGERGREDFRRLP